METLAYLYLRQNYEGANDSNIGTTPATHLMSSLLETLRQLPSSPTQLALLGLCCGVWSVALAQSVTAADLLIEDAGGGYVYVFQEAEPEKRSPSPASPVVYVPHAPAYTPVRPAYTSTRPACQPGCSDYIPVRPSGVLKYGATGAEVRSLQIALQQAGYYHGSIDGVFGNATRRAVVRFQHEHYLVTDGVVGASTKRVLGLV